MVVLLGEEDLKSFLTFSTKLRKDDHGTNIRESREWLNSIMIFESGVLER